MGLCSSRGGAETWREPPRGAGLRLRHILALLLAVLGWETRVAWQVTGMRVAWQVALPARRLQEGLSQQPAKNKDTVLESSVQGFIQHSPYVLNEAAHIAKGFAIQMVNFFYFYF